MPRGGANLHWAARQSLGFSWRIWISGHIFIPFGVTGGAPVLLTPGAFMVEHVAKAAMSFMIYDADTGRTAGDDDRRHLFEFLSIVQDGWS